MQEKPTIQGAARPKVGINIGVKRQRAKESAKLTEGALPERGTMPKKGPMPEGAQSSKRTQCPEQAQAQGGREARSMNKEQAHKARGRARRESAQERKST